MREDKTRVNNWLKNVLFHISKESWAVLMKFEEFVGADFIG